MFGGRPLLKSLVGVVFPVGTGLLYLFFTRQLFSARVWKRLHPFSGLAIVLCSPRPGTFWQRCVIRPTSSSLYIPAQVSTTAFSGFSSSMNNCSDSSIFVIPATTIRCRAFGSGYFTWFGYFRWSVYLPAVAKLSVQAGGSGQEDSAARIVLDRLRSHLFYVFDDPGILLIALLLSLCAAIGLGDGHRRGLGPSGHTYSLDYCGLYGGRYLGDFAQGAWHTCTGRYFGSPKSTSLGLYALTGPHAGSDSRFVRLSSRATGGGRHRVCRRCVGSVLRSGPWRAFLAAALMMVLFFTPRVWPSLFLSRTFPHGRWPRQ